MSGSDPAEGCFGCLFGGLFLAIGALIAYALIVIILRAAFGIELPNPVDWLPPEWQSYIPRKK